MGCQILTAASRFPPILCQNGRGYVSVRNLLWVGHACCPPVSARPLFRPRHMVGDHARLIVARRLAGGARMDRQHRAHRRRRLVAKPRGMGARGDLRRRPPPPPRPPHPPPAPPRPPPPPPNPPHHPKPPLTAPGR